MQNVHDMSEKDTCNDETRSMIIYVMSKELFHIDE